MGLDGLEGKGGWYVDVMVMLRLWIGSLVLLFAKALVCLVGRLFE